MRSVLAPRPARCRGRVLAAGGDPGVRAADAPRSGCRPPRSARSTTASRSRCSRRRACRSCRSSSWSPPVRSTIRRTRRDGAHDRGDAPPGNQLADRRRVRGPARSARRQPGRERQPRLLDVAGSFLARDFEAGLELMSDAAIHPLLAEAEFDAREGRDVLRLWGSCARIPPTSRRSRSGSRCSGTSLRPRRPMAPPSRSTGLDVGGAARLLRRPLASRSRHPGDRRRRDSPSAPSRRPTSGSGAGTRNALPAPSRPPPLAAGACHGQDPALRCARVGATPSSASVSPRRRAATRTRRRSRSRTRASVGGPASRLGRAEPSRGRSAARASAYISLKAGRPLLDAAFDRPRLRRRGIAGGCKQELRRLVDRAARRGRAGSGAARRAQRDPMQYETPGGILSDWSGATPPRRSPRTLRRFSASDSSS